MRRREQHLGRRRWVSRYPLLPGFPKSTPTFARTMRHISRELTSGRIPRQDYRGGSRGHAIKHTRCCKIHTRTLPYEAAHNLHVPSLWHSVASQRQKVFEMRSRVFDTGRRAPGPAKFNRVLWTLDGQETHVDWAGRTEEEVMEEHGLNDMQLLEEEEEEEREEREREAAPKPPPSWLLKMIASWGNRWGSRKKADDTGTKSPPDRRRRGQGHALFPRRRVARHRSVPKIALPRLR